MELSISDLSKHLGVAPNTIERWVRQGSLPVLKTIKGYSFRKKELEKWATRHNISLTLLESQPPEKSGKSDITLSKAVQTGGVYFDLKGNDVHSVLSAAVQTTTSIPDKHKADLLDRLLERETALSTGIGNGIAIPHPREQAGYLSDPAVSVFFLAHPVDYNALDQKPVSVLFLILCPELKMHLHLLSALSFCLRDSQFVNFLKQQPDQQDLVQQIERLQKENPL